MSFVKFKRKSWFNGRNGLFKSQGVVVYSAVDDLVVLSPIISRERIGNCDIAVPLENIDELIEVLKEASNSK